MWLRRTPFQQELADEARKALSTVWGSADIRSHDPASVRQHPAWSVVDGMGWRDLLMPASAGGLGLGPVEVGAVLEAAGASLLPGPLLGTVVAGPLVARAMGRASAVATAIAVSESGNEAPIAWTTTSVEGDRLFGTKVLVEGADLADEVVVVAGGSAGPVVAILDPDVAGVTITPLPTVDRLIRPTVVEFDGAQVLGMVDGDKGRRLLGHVETHALAAVAARLVGVADQLVTMAREFACTREQFGVPIGSFQAVQHMLADLHVAVETARASLHVAQASIAEGDTRAGHRARVAKARASEVGRVVAEGALQILGGIGFTTDHDLHLYYLHALSLQASWGDERHHAAVLGEALLDRVASEATAAST